MEEIRIGIVGIGGMGRVHIKSFLDNKVLSARVTAVCDTNPENIKWAEDNFKEGIETFTDYDQFINSSLFDGLIIVTPHTHHTSMAIKAFSRNLHVLLEKPAGVYTKEVRQMNEAANKSGQVFAIMFQQRTKPLYRKLKNIVESGEMGELKRTNWINTEWYRAQSYYDSAEWRATWAGEGGGVLLNQAPHQLDLWQWICGMPKRLRAFCYFGKDHDIEVEDDVTAFMEYENGATGVFITSTGDAPGTNRFEITGDRGKIVIEEDRMTFWRLQVPESEFRLKEGFKKDECRECEIPVEGEETGHPGIIQNWIESIQKGTPLIAPGCEGINSLLLTNAMYLSAWTDDWVDLPIDEDLFYEKLKQRIKDSRYKNLAAIAQEAS